MFSVDTLLRKLKGVRRGTSSALSASFSQVPPGVAIISFFAVGFGDAMRLIHQLPDKSSDADPRPIRWVMSLLVELFNRSLSTGVFPDAFKTALSTPVIKKPNVKVNDPQSDLQYVNCFHVS